MQLDLFTDSDPEALITRHRHMRLAFDIQPERIAIIRKRQMIKVDLFMSSFRRHKLISNSWSDVKGVVRFAQSYDSIDYIF